MEGEGEGVEEEEGAEFDSACDHITSASTLVEEAKRREGAKGGGEEETYRLLRSDEIRG